MKTGLQAFLRVGKKFPVPHSGAAVSVSISCSLLFMSSGVVCPGNVPGDIVPELSFSAIPMCILALSNGDRPIWRNITVFVSFVSLAVFILRISRFPAAWLAEHLKDILLASISVISAWVVAHSFSRCVPVRGNPLGAFFERHPGAGADIISLFILSAVSSVSSVLSGAGGLICASGLAVTLLSSLGLYGAIFVRLFTGRTFLPPSACSRPGIQETLVCSQAMARDGDDTAYRAVFDRLEEFFKNDKPYLDCDLNIADVARKLLTNKAYLSRAISYYTGRNFCQYVNWYRIRHSVDLFLENPKLKIYDLSIASGFRSMTTFSMAFRLYMNYSPGEWCRKNRKKAVEK